MNKNFRVLLTVLLVLILFAIYFKTFSINSKAESEISITSFGAKGNDKNDDTRTIQKTIDSINNKTGGTVYFPKGTYYIDTIKSLKLKDNITLKFGKGSVLRAIPNNSANYKIISIEDVKNVKITGLGKIYGDRKQHTGKKGEWGFGVSIRGSNNIHIENIQIYDCWGDGVYVGSTNKQNYSRDILIKKVIIKNNRRQGITVISARNLSIIDSTITDTKGTAPESGIDIEPNEPNEYLENIKIVNLSTKNNIGFGVQVYLKNLKGSNNKISIDINTNKKITDGISVREIKGIKGQIKVGNRFYLNKH